MPIYTLTQNPKKIQNLLYWFDASDLNSLSLTAIGSATASVVSIRDKASGVTLTNFGSQQPWYYYKGVNNKNTIYFLSKSRNPGDGLPITALRSISCTFSSIGSIYSVTKWGATQSGNAGAYAIHLSPSSRGTGTFGDFQLQYNTLINYGVFSTVGSSFNTAVGYFTGLTPNGNNSNINSVGTDVFATRYRPGFLKSEQINTYGGKHQPRNATYSITTSSNCLVLGSYHTPTFQETGYIGHFCEFIYFNRFLNDQEHNQILQYLRSKWLGR